MVPSKVREATRSCEYVHGMFGWFQVIHAIFVPSGDTVGACAKSVPSNTVMIALSSRAAEPSSGMATILFTGSPGAEWSSATAYTSSRTSAIQKSP